MHNPLLSGALGSLLHLSATTRTGGCSHATEVPICCSEYWLIDLLRPAGAAGVFYDSPLGA
jgi:hypothetical protein